MTCLRRHWGEAAVQFLGRWPDTATPGPLCLREA